MRDPHPLAIIPLQKDLLLSLETSSNSSHGSSQSSPRTAASGASDGPLPIRALVPHRGTPVASDDAERGQSPLRSEDDTALMRSLISVMPHERADSQFSVTSPVRRSDDSDKALRHESWFRTRRPKSSAFGRSRGAGEDGDGSSDNGEGRGGGRATGARGGFRGSNHGAGGNGGLDFLGTTDSVRDLFHLPFTNEAVTVGLHRVGQTLVLDGNLDEVLAPAAAAAAAATATSPPSSPPPTPSSEVPSAPAPTVSGHSNSSGSNSNTVVGGGDEEGRWVMVGRGGKPQQATGTQGRDGGQGWRHSVEENEGDYSGPRNTTNAPPRASMAARANGRRGWEVDSRISGKSTFGADTERQGRLVPSAASPTPSSSPSGQPPAREWSVTSQAGNWPALGVSATPAAAAASSSGDDAALVAPSDPAGDSTSGGGGGGILSIVPTRPRAQSFGVRPPEPVGFWRSFEWELAGMHLVLGSSLPVCSTSEHPQVSVRLHDGDEDLSLCTCLDYYLDNVMENVPELALCMREKGYIQGCRVVSTEDIPYLGSLSRKTAAATAAAAAESGSQSGGVGGSGVDLGTPVPMFDPEVVELNATMLLRFLQENCSREGGTYLLHRSEGATHVQLYDVSALSRQRHRRWKWLLAMLCYRFALRISHHTRQPWSWCRGGGGRASGAGDGSGNVAGTRGSSSSSSTSSSSFPAAADANGPVNVSSSAALEAKRQLQRRQRQLLENSLELLEELAELGGGGHETICASVQEHIADTYLGTQGGALPGPSSGNAEASRSRSRAGSITQESRGGTWTVDSQGEVWTSPPPLRPSSVAKNGGKVNATEQRRGDKGLANGSRKTGASRKSAKLDDDFEVGGVRRGAHPGSVRLGGGVSGDGGKVDRVSVGEEDVNDTAGRQREEDLDRAQDHLTSGIAILRGVMARQESAAAGRGDSAADVVIVGESKLPVAIMRQPEQSPWLAADDDDDDEGDSGRGEDTSQKERRGTRGKQDGRKRPGGGGHPRSRRRRRESIDESGDPTTALSVVSEQLWGLQQKLVGTYVAVARARLRRAFPDPALVATSSEGPSPPRSSSSTKHSRRANGGSARSSAGSGSRNPGKQKSGKTTDTEEGSRVGNGQLDDGPDEETRLELVRGALSSLTDAWEHLVEAKGTIDRRAAIVFTGEKGEEQQDEAKDGDARAAFGVPRGDKGADKAAVTPTGEGFDSGRQDERADNLGPLWKGSLSEALARSGNDSVGGGGDGGIGRLDAATGTISAPAAAGSVMHANGAGTTGAEAIQDADRDAMARLAWNRAARRQLETRRAELFELCGDVSHACLSLRARAFGSRTAAASPGGGGGGGSSTMAEALRSLPAQLEKLLSSAQPPLALQDLDVCQDLHGRVWESLNGNGELAGTNTNASSSSFVTSTGGKKVRGLKRNPTQADPEMDGTIPQPDGGNVADHAGTARRDPRPLAETCVHSLAKDGRVPGDSTAWSLCLAAEACYKRALVDLGMVAGVSIAGAPGPAAAASAVAVSGVPEAQARIRKKLGDASNELGKLMAQCAGALVQAPSPPARSDQEAASPSPRVTPIEAPEPVAAQPRHPGLGCAVCVACAEIWFCRSLAQFRAIDDARNTALLLCNLASVERLKPRAVARLREACPAGSWVSSPLTTQSSGGKKIDGRLTGATKDGVSARSQGAAAAVELCGEAHAALGRREEDERTWDHASRELAMAYLCLGVERRQELLAKLLRTDPAVTPEEGPDTKSGPTTKFSGSSAPTTAQARGVVGPLEQALQIYTDMNNAPQAAACHYQIGQYYAKVLPAYTGSGSGAPRESTNGFTSNNGGASGSICASGGGEKRIGARTSTFELAKAWEVGQRAARHFLAARAYFAPFEHGPTSVLLALDLCNLYLSLAEMGGVAANGSDQSSSGGRDGDDGAAAVPIPSVPVGRVNREGGAGGRTGPSSAREGGGGEGGHRPQPTAGVRFQCLEGALRALLDTRSVFADAGIAMGTPAEGGAEDQQQQQQQQQQPPPHQRLRRLLESVTERLPKVLQALVRASVDVKPSSVPSSFSPPSSASKVFKLMYRRSLMAMRDGGEGSQAMLDGLTAEYEAVAVGGASASDVDQG